MDQAAPKKFEQCIKKLNEITSEKPTALSSSHHYLKLKSNESLKSYKIRLQQETTRQIGQINKESKQIRSGRKEFLKRFKNKGKPIVENSEIESDLKKRSKVQFGEVVSEPPSLTKFPKIKQKLSTEIEAQRNRAIQLYRQLKDKS